MIHTPLFKRFFVLLLVVALLNLLADRLYLYWSLWHFDTFVHLLSGICVAMGIILVFFHNQEQNPNLYRVILYSVVGALIVGALWEAYELFFGITFLSDGIRYLTDTSSDLLADILGGFVGALYSLKLLKNKNG